MFKNLNTSVLGVSGNQSEIIELALTHGFKAIDLDMVDFANRAKLRGMPYARRLIDSSKLTIATFDLPFGLDSPEDVFQKDLRASVRIGVDGGGAWLHPVPDDVGPGGRQAPLP